MARAATHKSELGTDSRGNFRRRLGKRLDGQIQTFYLGTNEREAEKRNHALEELWERTKVDWPNVGATWTEAMLQVAKAIARGDKEITVERPEGMKGNLARLAQQDMIRE